MLKLAEVEVGRVITVQLGIVDGPQLAQITSEAHRSEAGIHFCMVIPFRRFPDGHRRLYRAMLSDCYRHTGPIATEWLIADVPEDQRDSLVTGAPCAKLKPLFA